MDDSLARRVLNCPTLPSLPAVAVKILELTQQPHVDILEIGRVISKDPALASKILQTVNSSFFGLTQKVSRISHALPILGLHGVKTLALGFSLVKALKRTPPRTFNHLYYWRRSIYSAIAARTICSRIKLPQQEEAFLAALLMDLGMLVLDQVVGEGYADALAKSPTHHDLARAEERVLGITHPQVARMLAEHWGLPPILSVPMGAHHAPDDVAIEYRDLTRVVWLAGRCADVFVEERSGSAMDEVRMFCTRQYGFAEGASDAMLDEIRRQTGEVAPLLDIGLNTSINGQLVLSKAKEGLVSLTLSVNQEKQQLKRQASTDSLTRLANRAAFDAFIERAVNHSKSRNTAVALLMLDIDLFKAINDEHGHQAGDEVLRVIGRLLATAARGKGVAARYGGEEMAVILPGMTAAAAARLAETVKRAVEARPIRCEAASVAVTVSIGVAARVPGGPIQTPAHLVKAADMALYNAKHSGRNCVRVFAWKSADAAPEQAPAVPPVPPAAAIAS